jgi:hypothetical protein
MRKMRRTGWMRLFRRMMRMRTRRMERRGIRSSWMLMRMMSMSMRRTGASMVKVR